MTINSTQHLGNFLKEKRQSLDAKALGYGEGRRRTPGLRREEVAARACISTTWYTWLEQGRGGTPSAAALTRVAKALCMSEAETEYLFLTTLGRLPQVNYSHTTSIDSTLQTIVDALFPNPALIRNLRWDVLAWNRSAATFFTNYGELPPDDRNIMRQFFLRKAAKDANPNWQSTARIIVSALRADLARLGEDEGSQQLIAELCEGSDIFNDLWHSHNISDVRDGVKHLKIAGFGTVNLRYSSFNVSSSPELSLIVYTPVSEGDKRDINNILNNCTAPAE